MTKQQRIEELEAQLAKSVSLSDIAALRARYASDLDAISGAIQILDHLLESKKEEGE